MSALPQRRRKKRRSLLAPRGLDQERVVLAGAAATTVAVEVVEEEGVQAEAVARAVLALVTVKVAQVVTEAPMSRGEHDPPPSTCVSSNINILHKTLSFNYNF